MSFRQPRWKVANHGTFKGIVIFLVFAMKKDTMKKLKAWVRSVSSRKGSGLQRLNNSSLKSDSSNSNHAVRLRSSGSAKSEETTCSRRSTAISDIRFGEN